MRTPLLNPLENLLNRGIDASVEARKLRRELSGRSLRLDLSGLPGSIMLNARDEGLSLEIGAPAEADCIIRGLPLTLLRAGLGGSTQALQSGNAEVSGDPVVAQDFQRLLDLAKPDWEEDLSALVGDVAAHQAGNLVRALADWGRNLAEVLARDAGEYLSEESRHLPSRFEVEEFLDDVDRLRDDVERFIARLARTEREHRGDDR
mgnify:FL=1